MMQVHESVVILDSDAQDVFQNLVDNSSLQDIVTLLNELGVDNDKLKGAVYGWALNEAGLY